MSKAAKKSIFILMGLLIVALVFAVLFYMDFQKTEMALDNARQKLSQAESELDLKGKQHAEAVRNLNDEISKAKNEKEEYAQKFIDIKRQADKQVQDFEDQIREITIDRDKWKRRIEEISKTRDQLMDKISELTKQLEEKPEPQIVYKEREPAKNAPIVPPVDVSRAPSFLPDSGKVVDEEYWANLIQEKASLEIGMEKLKDQLSEKSILAVEAKQINEDLEMETKALKHEKEELETEIQHKMNVIDNISLELARTKNDKKYIADRVKILNEENGGLRQDMKKLISVKNALEKSIVRLTQEKGKVENQLGKTETIIQSKIDEIWEIKDDLDESIRSSKTSTPSSGGVELPPIVVNSNGQGVSYNTGEASPGLQGRVISVNESNNFVIVDLGQNSGINLGDNLSVYRDSKYIARLEVIQIRKDISAADLKDQWSKIMVGDIVR